MIIARSGALLIVGIDASNLAMIQADQPLQIKVPPGGEPVQEIVFDYEPTLTALVAKWKKAGLLPPDLPFKEPPPTKTRH